MEDLLQVGVITSTHGIRGEVKVFPTTDDAARFPKYSLPSSRAAAWERPSAPETRCSSPQ